MNQIDYIEVDLLDFRLGLTELLSAHGKIDQETNRLINTVIAETKYRAQKEALKTYVEEGIQMSHADLIKEEHRSKKLGEFLQTAGYSRPDQNFEAHALVSGGHKRSVIARDILAQFNIRIDDPANGLWLPNFKRNLKFYPQYQYAHRPLHNKTYYLNITACLEQAMSASHARAILRRVAQGLINGSISINRRMRAREIMEFVNG
ncbi:AHH domain-containing protein [Sessilibacter sp. MAH4]